MSGGAKPVNIARLMAAFNLEIEMVPDNLKCAECESVLKDAWQVPCGCRFCRACIDAVKARGAQFCLGGSQECGETPLSTALQDYGTNKSISRLTAKCPHTDCSHDCPLADMEGHLQVCPRKSVDCPFRELGCLQGKLAAEELSGHLQQESGNHSQILVRMVANMDRDMEVLKRELVLKDEQMRTIMDEMRHVQNENKSIKREKEVLSERVRQLSEKLEQEIDERRENARITAMGTEMESVKEDIQSINRHIQSIKGDIDSMNAQVQVGLERANTVCREWLITDNLVKTNWYMAKTSDKFKGVAHPYTYQLASWNHVSNDELCIGLRIWADPCHCHVEWPFRGEVSITVAPMDRPAVCKKQTLECQIERPVGSAYSWSDALVFRHSELRAAGMDLCLGVRVSCQIVPAADQ